MYFLLYTDIGGIFAVHPVDTQETIFVSSGVYFYVFTFGLTRAQNAKHMKKNAHKFVENAKHIMLNAQLIWTNSSVKNAKKYKKQTQYKFLVNPQTAVFFVKVIPLHFSQQKYGSECWQDFRQEKKHSTAGKIQKKIEKRIEFGQNSSVKNDKYKIRQNKKRGTR